MEPLTRFDWAPTRRRPMDLMRKFVWALTRRKPMDVSEEAPTDLARCLNTLDLTAMGVGATLGFGLYVLTGEVAAEKAGPGVVLSFMIAAIASTFSALCYAEFAAKVPKSGSAYAYSYITVGEFVAFVIGWNLTLEHMIGTAALARGYSGYIRLFQAFALNSTTATSNATADAATGHGLVTDFDSLAFTLTMLVMGLLLLGVQVSSRFQITFATLNLSVACFIVACGLFKADFHNWNLSKTEIPAQAGAGGFLPFGWTGVIAGASTCFFSFVGFDGIAATAEEVKNPRKAIPNSILWTSVIIFITYFGMSSIQTLMWPYWDQNKPAPLPYIFERLDMSLAKWIVLVGVLAGLSTSFVGGFLPLPRILYAMARDGVIYRVLSIVSKRFKVPYVATIIGGLIIACLASKFNIKELAEMLSIGTLAAYSLVSISVLLLRYEHRKPTKCENPLPITFQEHREALDTELERKRKGGNNDGNGNNNRDQKTPGEQKGENINATMNGVVSLDSGAQKAKPIKRLTANGGNAVAATELAPHNESADSAGSSVGSSNTSTSSSSSSSNTSSLGSLSSSTSASHNIDGQSRCSKSSLSCQTSSRSLFRLFFDGTKGADNAIRRPDEQTTHISRVMILILIVVTTSLDIALVFQGDALYELDPIAITTCSGLFILTLALGFLLNRLPVAEPSTNSFEVPLVPTIPLFSVIINTYLMLNLSVMTWNCFAIWMAVGFFIYFTYGIFHSTGYKDSRCD